jgi:hypothetical protein
MKQKRLIIAVTIIITILIISEKLKPTPIKSELKIYLLKVIEALRGD